MAHDFDSNYAELRYLRQEQEFQPDREGALLAEIETGFTYFGNPVKEYYETIEYKEELRRAEIAAVQRLLTLHHRFNRTRHRNRA